MAICSGLTPRQKGAQSRRATLDSSVRPPRNDSVSRRRQHYDGSANVDRPGQGLAKGILFSFCGGVEQLRKAGLAVQQGEVKTGAHIKLVYDADAGEVDGDEFDAGEGEGSFAGADHDDEVARASVDDVGCDLDAADGAQGLVEGLDGEELDPLKVGIFEGADGGTEDAAEKHGDSGGFSAGTYFPRIQNGLTTILLIGSGVQPSGGSY